MYIIISGSDGGGGSITPKAFTIYKIDEDTQGELERDLANTEFLIRIEWKSTKKVEVQREIWHRNETERKYICDGIENVNLFDEEDYKLDKKYIYYWDDDNVTPKKRYEEGDEFVNQPNGLEKDYKDEDGVQYYYRSIKCKNVTYIKIIKRTTDKDGKITLKGDDYKEGATYSFTETQTHPEYQLEENLEEMKYEYTTESDKRRKL